MSQTERIEKYLLGELSTQEEQAFEKELETNTELSQELELQEAITKRVQRMAFLTALDGFDPNLDFDDSIDDHNTNQNQSNNNVDVSSGNSAGQGGTNLLMKSIIGITTTIIVGVTAYFYSQPSENPKNDLQVSSDTVQEEKIVTTIEKQNTTIIKELSSEPVVHNPQVIKVTEEKIEQIIVKEIASPFSIPEEWFYEYHKQQSFTIVDPKKSKVITTKGGVKLFFPAGIFKSDEAIQVDINEYLDFYSTLYLMSPARSTKKELLQTEGIIEIAITKSIKGTRKAIREIINLNHDFKISFPKKNLYQQDCFAFTDGGSFFLKNKIKWKKYTPKKDHVDDLTPTSMAEAMSAMQREEAMQVLLEQHHKSSNNKYHTLTVKVNDGWINAATPVFVTNETVDIEMQSSLNANLWMTIEKTSIILKPVKKKDKYIFKNVPKGVSVTVFGIAEREEKTDKVYETAKVIMKAGIENKELIYTKTSKKGVLEFIQNIE